MGNYAPLHVAAYAHLEVVNRLLTGGADPMRQTNNRWIMLHSAASNENGDVVNRLLERQKGVPVSEKYLLPLQGDDVELFSSIHQPTEQVSEPMRLCLHRYIRRTKFFTNVWQISTLQPGLAIAAFETALSLHSRNACIHKSYRGRFSH